MFYILAAVSYLREGEKREVVVFEQLFGSKTRVKLLKLFFNNTSRSFYVREITRKINEQINSVRRELSNLVSVGLITSKSEDNRLYYHLNPKFEFYNDFKNIFSKITSEVSDENKFGKKLRQVGKIFYAHLGGFFTSDFNTTVDLLIVGEVNKAKLAEVVSELEKENHREINYSVLTLEEFNYRSMLYDRFLTELLDAPKIVLINDLPKKTQLDEPDTKKSAQEAETAV